MMRIPKVAIDRWLLLTGTGAVAVIYIIAYYLSNVRPRVSAQYPLGWWGWFDQGEYLKSVKAFSTLNFASSEHLYPPLYNMLAAPFVFVFPSDPHFIPNLIFICIYFFVLMSVARRFYGIILPTIASVCILAFLPLLSTTQWIIPWTTSLQAAIFSVLIFLFSDFEDRSRPFVIKTRRDWMKFFGFFLAYGAIAPTRPLDIVVLFPFSLWFFVKTTLETSRIASKGSRWKTVALCGTTAGAGGIVFVIFYFAFNILVSGSPLGVYFAVNSRNFYYIDDIPEKLFSMFWSSGVIYGEVGQAFFERIPLFGTVFAVCFVAIFFLSDVRRWIVVSAFLHIVLYLPYGDLLPTGLFRYYNLHYFKWTYPWLVVIAAGQVWFWLVATVKRENGLNPIVACIAVLIVGSSVRVVTKDRERVVDSRSAEANVLLVRARHEREVDFIDFEGLQGGFNDLYFGEHRLSVDGVPAEKGTYRMLPIAEGARLLFLRPHVLSEIELKPGPGVRIGAKSGSSVISSYGYAVEFGR